jgi:hypothetical protein
MVGALYREDCGRNADSYIVLYGEGVLRFLFADPLMHSRLVWIRNHEA